MSTADTEETLSIASEQQQQQQKTLSYISFGQLQFKIEHTNQKYVGVHV